MSFIFIPEGSHAKGMGDVYATLPVAMALVEAGAEVSYITMGRSGVQHLVQAQGFEATHASSLDAALKMVEHGTARVVIFSRQQTAARVIRRVRAGGRFAATLDDTGPGGSVADLRINPLYRIPDSLFGPDYLPLHPDFLQSRKRRTKNNSGPCKTLLLTQGAADSRGFMPGLLKTVEEALLDVAPDCSLSLVVGPCFAQVSELRAQAAQCRVGIELLENLTSLAPVMQRTDLAVTAGGITLFELCCVGVPSLVVCAEPFEAESSAFLAQRDSVVDIGFSQPPGTLRLGAELRSLLASPEKRGALATAARQVVDGQGARRIADKLLALAKERL